MSYKSALLIALFLMPLTLWCATTQNIDIQADVFELDGKTNEVFASSNVRVTQKDVVMTGKNAKYNQKTQKLSLSGPIQIDKGEMRLFCDSVVAYGKEETIEAIGHIKFNYIKIHGEADFAVYNRLTQKITLTGNPRAWQGQDEVTGMTIWIDLKREKITTEGKARIHLSVETLQQKNKGN